MFFLDINIIHVEKSLTFHCPFKTFFFNANDFALLIPNAGYMNDEIVCYFIHAFTVFRNFFHLKHFL